MRNGMKIWVVFFAAVVVFCFGQAAMAEGDFELTVGKRLEVLHGGEVLVADDHLTYSEGWGAGKMKTGVKGDMVVVNTFRKDSDVFRYRREVGVSDERIELTCQFRLMPYHHRPEVEPQITYKFRVPYGRLKNTTFKAFKGRARGPKLFVGELDESRADGVLATGVRYIAFEGEKSFVFDLNPKGLTTNMDYGYGGFIGSWRVAKKGGYIEFSFGRTAYFWGGTQEGKVLIYEGKYDFEKVHSYTKYHEMGGYHLDRTFFFGSGDGPEGWLNGGSSSYNAEAGFGWDKPGAVEMTANAGKGIVHNAAYGKGSNMFTCDVTPGIYAVSFRVGGIDSGPFDIALNDEVLIRGVTVKAGEVTNVHLRKYIRSDKLCIKFLSKKGWAVSSIIVQPIIYAYEDFAFDRGPWLIDGIFTPQG